MSQQTNENHRSTQSVSRAASAAPPPPETQPTEDNSSFLEMPGGMPSATTLLHPIPQRLSRATTGARPSVTRFRVLATEESPNPDSTILPAEPTARTMESSFQEVEEMTRVIEGQAAEAIIRMSAPPAATGSGADTNPIQIIAAALWSGLTALQQRTNTEIARNAQAMADCERLLTSQGTRLEDTRKRAGAAQDNAYSAYHAAKEAESATRGAGLQIRNVNDSIGQITSTIKEINQGLINQAKGLRGVEEILTALEQQITNLANEVRDFRETSTWRTTTQAPAVEPAAQTQGAVLTEDEGGWDDLPMCPYSDRHTSFARESTTKPEGLRRVRPPTQKEADEGEEPYLNQTTTAGMTIPKEAQTKKPEPFSRKTGKEGEAFIVRMEVHFQDYQEGTFNDNWKIRATLMNMSTGDAMNWAQPLLRLSAAQENHEFLESWDSFKKGFLMHFSDPTKKEKAVRELSKLTQTTSAQNYTVVFRMLAQEVDWNEQALKDQYMEGLKPQVKMELMRLQIFGEPENVTLEQWIALACKADNMIYANSKINSNKTPAHSSSRVKGGTMPRTHYKGKEASITAKVILVPNEEKDQRRKEGLCIKCAKPGHVVKECWGQWTYDRKGKNTRGKAAKVDDEETKEDSESESEN